jgi:hypothetical protein
LPFLFVSGNSCKKVKLISTFYLPLGKGAKRCTSF